MGKIIIFKDIWDKALEGLENLVLFGEENWVKDPNKVYDLIFHSRQTNPYNQEKNTSLVIPVLKNLSDDEAVLKINQLSIEHPVFDRYAVSGEFLDFYKVIKKENGNEIKLLGKYNVITEKKFIKSFGSKQLQREINERRRVINHRY